MKRIVSVAFLVVVLAVPAMAEKVYKLNSGIEQVAKNLTSKLPMGTKVVILDIKSAKPEASNYIVEELTYQLLEIGTLVVVDRQSLEAIRNELSLQVSGDVSDESAQRLGAMLGAQTLITGSFELLKGKYRFAVKAVKVETSEIQYMSALSVYSNDDTEALLGQPSPRSAAAASVGNAARKVMDFTGRAIAMSVNPFFGIGSFMQGDSTGGSNIAFGEVAGIGAIAYGAYRAENDQSNAVLISRIGYYLVGGMIVYSWVRPWMYNRHPEVAEVLDNVRVGYTSADSVTLGYSWSY